MAEQTTDSLQDILLPPPAGWWPPAPGWWLLLLGLIVLMIAVWLWRRRAARRGWVNDARQELDALRSRPIDSAVHCRERLGEYSVLLRRVALATAPREQVAGLTGEQWLAQLDRLSGTQRFSREVGVLLRDAPYRKSVAVSADDLRQLDSATEHLLRQAARSRSAPEAGE
jgi:hypothetical protein